MLDGMSVAKEAPRSGWRTPSRLLLLAAGVGSLLVARPFFFEIGAGLVFGYVTERPLDWCLKRLRREGSMSWRWAVATTLLTSAILLLLVPAAMALWIALRDLVELMNGASPGAYGRLGERVRLWSEQRASAFGLRLNVADLMRRAQGFTGSAAAVAARIAGRVLTATPAAVFSLVLVLVASVTFAVEGPALRARVLPEMLPWPRERAVLTRTTAGVIEGVVLANLGVSFIQAAVVAVATIVLRIPNAAVWSVASFALSFVPFVGTALVTVSAAAYLFAVNRGAAGIAMLVVAVIAGSIDNVLRPLLTRGSIELNFLWRLVAFVGGIAVFGVAGVIVGPLVLAWTQALWVCAHEREP